MKPLQLIFIFLVNLLFSATAQELATYLKDANIKGKVKSITQVYKEVENPNEYLKNEYLFNVNGQLIKNASYLQDKPIESVTDYNYDVKGFLISEIQTNITTGKVERKEIFVNDIKGRLIKQTSYEEGSTQPSYLTTYTRSSTGKILIDISKILPDNAETYKNVYKYDVKGNVIEKINYLGGAFTRKATYLLFYNEKGLIKKKQEVERFQALRLMEMIIIKLYINIHTMRKIE